LLFIYNRRFLTTTPVDIHGKTTAKQTVRC